MFRHAATAAAAIAAASPAVAQEGAWKVADGRVTLPSAKLSVPATLPGLTLTQTGEFSNKGKALDNYAQFKSPDEKLFVTVYVYRTTYPDAALADHATDRAIRTRFGDKVSRAESVVALGDRPGAAIRAVYEGGELGREKVVTAAAYARAGDWLVKLRASGPASRSGEITGALDAVLASLRLDAGVPTPAAAPLALGPACATPEGKKAKPVRSKDANADMVLGGLISSISTNGKEPATRFPANGSTRACVRGTTGPGGVTLLQAADEAAPRAMVAALNDAGTVLSVEPALLGGGYVIKTYVVGAVETRGTLDRMPTAAQLSGWLAERDAEPLRLRSRTVVGLDGKMAVEVSAGALR